MRLFRHMAVLALLPALCGCPVPQVVVPELPPITEFEAVVSAFARRDAVVRSLRARMRVKVQADGEKPLSTTVLVTLRRPGALRVEALGPVDELEALFVMKDGRYTAVSMPDKKVRNGVAGEEALERALGLRMAPDEAESVLCGTVRLVEFTQGQIGADEPQKEVVVLIEKPGGEKQIIRADRETLAVKKVETSAAEGDKISTVEFEEISTVMGIPFPHRVKATFAGRVKSLNIAFREIEINPEIKDEEFLVEIPKGFAVE
ncbi:MAG: DUF4292 domain-containing protein [Deltaproteobacteria bacterium]|nr:DUF4292 domain-containing protein [Deltaproteobacteria bacterium]